MALERVGGLSQTGPMVRALATRTATGTVTVPAIDAMPPLLRLRVLSAFDGGLLARNADGLPLQIPASSLAGQTWAPGQLLLVRVVSTSPQLELAVLGPAEEDPMGRPGPGREPGAMQADQAGLRRLLSPALDVPALAARWRSMVLLRLQQSVPAPAGAALGWAHGGATVPGAEPPPATLQPTLVFHTLLWPGAGLTFWPAQPRPRRARPGAPARAMAQSMGLLLVLPDLGEVRIDVSVYGSAVALSLATQSAASVPLLRSRTSLITTSLARAGLRLMQCQVACTPSPLPMAVLPATAQQLASVDTTLPPGLFRAAAEVLNALNPPFR